MDSIPNRSPAPLSFLSIPESSVIERVSAITERLIGHVQALALTNRELIDRSRAEVSPQNIASWRERGEMPGHVERLFTKIVRQELRARGCDLCALNRVIRQADGATLPEYVLFQPDDAVFAHRLPAYWQVQYELIPRLMYRAYAASDIFSELALSPSEWRSWARMRRVPAHHLVPVARRLAEWTGDPVDHALHEQARRALSAGPGRPPRGHLTARSSARLIALFDATPLSYLDVAKRTGAKYGTVAAWLRRRMIPTSYMPLFAVCLSEAMGRTVREDGFTSTGDGWLDILQMHASSTNALAEGHPPSYLVYDGIRPRMPICRESAQSIS